MGNLESGAFGCRLVGDQRGVQLGVDAKPDPNRLHQGQRLWAVRAVRNVEDLDHRRFVAVMVSLLSVCRLHGHSRWSTGARTSKPARVVAVGRTCACLAMSAATVCDWLHGGVAPQLPDDVVLAL